MSPALPGRGDLVLALDTATDFPSLALGTPAAPGEELRPADRRALSREIERTAEALLAARGASVREVRAVLVADGPGSFTGLRIGAAFAKGLCRALGVPLLTAPSLLGAAAAAAARCGCARPLEVVACYDALRGECFRAAYRVGDAAVEVLAAPGLAPAAEQGALAGRNVRAGEHDASAAALLSLVGLPGGPQVIEAPGPWEPAYGRLAEAEARRVAREGAAS